MHPYPRGAFRPSYARHFALIEQRRAQGRPGARMHPRALARKNCAKARRPQVQAESHRPSLRSGLRLIRDLLGEPCRLPPSQATMLQHRRQLGASLWGARTTRFRSSAKSAARQSAPSRPPQPASRLMTIAMRPSWVRRDGTRMLPICRNCKGARLRQIGTTGNLRMGGMRERRVNGWRCLSESAPWGKADAI